MKPLGVIPKPLKTGISVKVGSNGVYALYFPSALREKIGFKDFDNYFQLLQGNPEQGDSLFIAFNQDIDDIKYKISENKFHYNKDLVMFLGSYFKMKARGRTAHFHLECESHMFDYKGSIIYRLKLQRSLWTS